ncbi:MAG: UbiX family flavin prenyltransferase [Flavobacteriales bacterium]
MNKKKVVVGVTGASGSIYAKVLFDRLAEISNQIEEVGVVFSSNARDVWKIELGNTDYANLPYKVYEPTNFMAPFASGSAKFETMIICPCSMGTMARIASGISNDLMTRAADVVLKERRKLILVPRDTPMSLIHINNMKTITEAGGIIAPASPSFYSNPKDFEELAKTVVDRVLDLAGFDLKSYRWSENDGSNQ